MQARKPRAKAQMVLLLSGSALLGLALGRAAPQAVPGRFAPTDVQKNVEPCVDFYQYACGNWINKNPIPSDMPAWGRGSELGLRNQNVLKEILEKAQTDSKTRSAVDRQIGDHYTSCMDEAGLEKRGTGPIQAELQPILAMKSKAELPQILATLHKRSGTIELGDSGSRAAVFGFTAAQDFADATLVVAVVDQGGLGLPDRDYYLKDDEKSKALRQKYKDHVTTFFSLLGEPKARAQAAATTVLEFESALARASMDIVKRRDAQNLDHKMSLAQLSALAPSFSFPAYLQAMAAPKTAHFQVYVPEFVKGFEVLLRDKPLAAWQDYLRWHVAKDAAGLLPSAFVQENFAFFGKTLRGAKELRPRWKRCVSRVDADLGEALGRAYVEKTFGEDGKKRMLALVQALTSAMDADIATLPWMSETTKKEAIAKLKAIENKIGYPDTFRDYSSVRITRDDLLGNAARASEFEVKRQLAKIGKPVDRSEWLMTPSTVNAYYDPQMNTINFPAGILQPPFFDRGVDDGVNIGAIGSVIGHELTHGFDDSGRKFDAKGNLRDWWTAADGKEFETRAQCISDQYSQYQATDEVKLNGKLTLGENTADAGGLRVAYMAMQDLIKKGKVPKKTGGQSAEQRFFLAYAQAWCSSLSPEYLRVMAASNPHSPPQYRVNGVVANLPEFAKAFSCKPGQPMMRTNACRVW